MIPVRAATVDDFDAMAALYREFIPDDVPADPAKARAAWAALVGSDLATVLIAEAGAVPAATCTLVVVPNLTRGARSYALVENVVTAAAHRRRGFGRVVMEEAIRRAEAAGCYKIMLATGARAGSGVIAFYESVGLARSGKTFFELRRV